MLLVGKMAEEFFQTNGLSEMLRWAAMQAKVLEDHYVAARTLLAECQNAASDRPDAPRWRRTRIRRRDDDDDQHILPFQQARLEGRTVSKRGRYEDEDYEEMARPMFRGGGWTEASRLARPADRDISAESTGTTQRAKRERDEAELNFVLGR